ncbi:hypothetical protein FOA52_013864 [Chlamydomonas sp. UWO 241]|nr:hypothetical protein FOA52_013864 [Chlamydomonas sp. UWO 241]
MFCGVTHTALATYEAPPLRDVQLVLIAFDALYVDGVDLCARPLRERHIALQAALRACPEGGVPLARAGSTGACARLLPLLPGVPLGLHTRSGGTDDAEDVPFSKLGSSLKDIEDMNSWAVSEADAEGLVVKALDSKWEMKQRGNSWLKIKPDYGSGCEINCLVITTMAVF